MPATRGQAKSADRTPRKIRVAWLRLHCLKSNPDRGISNPIVMLTQSDVTMCRRFMLSSATSLHGEIPGDDLGSRDEWTT
jgi:hypothetical protein